MSDQELLWYASVCQPDCMWCCCGDGPANKNLHVDCPDHDKARGKWPWRALTKMTKEERAEYVKNRPLELRGTKN